MLPDDHDLINNADARMMGCLRTGIHLFVYHVCEHVDESLPNVWDLFSHFVDILLPRGCRITRLYRPPNAFPLCNGVVCCVYCAGESLDIPEGSAPQLKRCAMVAASAIAVLEYQTALTVPLFPAAPPVATQAESKVYKSSCDKKQYILQIIIRMGSNHVWIYGS